MYREKLERLVIEIGDGVQRNLISVRDALEILEKEDRMVNSPRDVYQQYQKYIVSQSPSSKGMQWSVQPGSVSASNAQNYYTYTTDVTSSQRKSDLEKAREIIEEMKTTLERIQKEPLIVHRVGRISKCKKFTFIKKGDIELRIEAPANLQLGDDVTVHPKTFQIVENLGRPPLEASRFSPIKIPETTWDDIGGLEEAKADMIESIEMPHKNKNLFKHYSKRPVKGILLSGPPGCGKTLLGKAAANSLATIYGKENARTGFLYVKGPEILDKYVGATEETIRDMFFDANRHHEEKGYPAIIFIDEADAILASRGSRSIGIVNSIVPAFLTEMDGMNDSSAIVILATNRPDILDPAIIRDGRIDRKVTVTRPDLANGTNILHMNLKRFPVSNDYDHKTMAEDMAAEFYADHRYVGQDRRLRDIVNGAMLSGLVDLAVSFAIRRDIAEGAMSGILPDDVIKAIDRMQHMNHGIRYDLEEAA